MSVRTTCRRGLSVGTYLYDVALSAELHLEDLSDQEHRAFMHDFEDGRYTCRDLIARATARHTAGLVSA